MPRLHGQICVSVIWSRSVSTGAFTGAARSSRRYVRSKALTRAPTRHPRLRCAPARSRLLLSVGFGEAMRYAILALVLATAPAMAQTQFELNQTACSEYQAADKKLNAIYQQVLARHEIEPTVTAKIKTSQRAWLAFRDAQLEAIYPASAKRQEYGSVYPMCSCSESTALINQRIEQLSGWLNGEEGDVCRGSR